MSHKYVYSSVFSSHICTFLPLLSIKDIAYRSYLGSLKSKTLILKAYDTYHCHWLCHGKCFQVSMTESKFWREIIKSPRRLSGPFAKRWNGRVSNIKMEEFGWVEENPSFNDRQSSTLILSSCPWHERSFKLDQVIQQQESLKGPRILKPVLPLSPPWTVLH